ncbi:fatty acid desaturase [Streptomyces sp. NPDC006733]|uniref:fatty acid desaturase n=1 Tax=Streptomyces sp. NPDC006733 TaxID=3155460 RepID=UPI003407432D
MLLALSLLAAGTVLRQVDRAYFARHRPHRARAADLIALQRARANNWTPTVLLVGQWVQIAGWWSLAGHGAVAAAAAALAVAVQLRHLQEIAHAAVHGILARTARANLLLAETLVQLPLGLAPATERRQRHVRDHHPNATLATDPNLAELHRAGLLPGVTGPRFAAALLYPLTARGLAATAADLAENLLRSPGRWARAAAVCAVLSAAYLIGGLTAVVCGVLIPRLLLYPQLAWLSLLVEHTWFDPEPRSGAVAYVEAGRCLRLYPRNRVLALLAATTWLPYGDLYHYAHSAHPAVRWNYLPALERHLGAPHFIPTGLVLGSGSVARRHLAALNPSAAAVSPVTAPTPIG